MTVRRMAAGIVGIPLILGLAGPVQASQAPTISVAGPVLVIDGDTLDGAGTRVRLHGIDAPESRQSCWNASGEAWACGIQATRALAAEVGDAEVICVGDRHDRYRRVIARCFLDGSDLNRWMVANGWAVAYRRFAPDYLRDEDGARADKVGVWSGTFMMPWDWRAAQPRR